MTDIFRPGFTLENDRALLRPLQTGDYELLLPFTIQEPTLWEYSLFRPDTPKNLKKYIAEAIKEFETKTTVAFIVLDKIKNAIAGSTRYYRIDIAQKNLLIGYTWYGKDYQGTGLNKKCKSLLFQYAFETLGMERVELRADNDNLRSKAAMHSIGATEEGVLRSESYKVDGSRRDSVVFSILKEEWPQLQL